jgi:hypothetical protein
MVVIQFELPDDLWTMRFEGGVICHRVVAAVMKILIPGSYTFMYVVSTGIIHVKNVHVFVPRYHTH